MNNLTARKVATITHSRRYSDGAGLYLRVDHSCNKRWVFRYTPQPSAAPREMGLGSAHSGGVSLASARILAQAARDTLQRGDDPLAVKECIRSEKLEAVTFGIFADQFVEQQAANFRNLKHVAHWKMTLTVYAAPIRKMSLDAITTDDILHILQPMWQTKPETAHRLRGRIERVLNAAKARGLRSGENPAAWRGHLELLLPKRVKLQRGHFAAMPYQDVPEFIEQLRTQKGTAARALEFLILGACRSGEVRYIEWSELDLENGVWTLPSHRMKAGRQHRVPITKRMNELLEGMKALHPKNEYVFTGPVKHNPFSDAALSAVLKRMKITNCTVHGFRSSFRDWVGDATDFPREIAETALAHVVGDATEQAYRRGDAFEKRQVLMQAWGKHCGTVPSPRNA